VNGVTHPRSWQGWGWHETMRNSQGRLVRSLRQFENGTGSVGAAIESRAIDISRAVENEALADVNWHHRGVQHGFRSVGAYLNDIGISRRTIARNHAVEISGTIPDKWLGRERRVKAAVVDHGFVPSLRDFEDAASATVHISLIVLGQFAAR
jgi:hypothetical protein